MDEISVFIQSVSEILEDFPAAIEKEATLNQSTHSDMAFLLYCLHSLIPVLSNLFQQLNVHRHSGSTYCRFDVISANSLNIFNRLYYPTETYTAVFIKRFAI